MAGLERMDLDPGIARYIRESEEAFAGQTGKEPWPERRAALTEFSRRYNPPYPAGLRVSDESLRAEGRRIPIRLYRPAGDRPRPGIVFTHGGGWVQGNLDTHDSAAAGLAEGIGAVVVSVDYRLAPEHPYPAAFDDTWAVLDHVASHAADFGIDPARLAVAGDSAGGNLAAAAALAARDRGGPALRAQLLIYPCLSSDLSFASYSEYAAGPFLTTDAMRTYWSLYLDGTANDPLATPLAAKDLSGLPPTFITVARHDPVRDDGPAYGERLKAAGVPVEYRCADLLTHGWLRARHMSEAAGKEFAALCDAGRRLLA
jgi:acetyl esterase